MEALLRHQKREHAQEFFPVIKKNEHALGFFPCHRFFLDHANVFYRF